MTSSQEVTQLLNRWSAGDKAALDELVPLVYTELRHLADGYLRHERSDHTLQPTALVNEAYIHLVDLKSVTWQNRAHFLCAAAQVMRHILVDHERRRRADKRGGGATKLSFDDAVNCFAEHDVNLLLLDDVLTALASVDAQMSRVVELRFFGGLTIAETAEVLNVSPATISRDWSTAKLWLLREMERRR
jgi:RNA polymerase sigma factor (TIGR02999 family)